MGCFLAERPGSPSFLIPVNLAWKFHAEKYRIRDAPKNSPEILEPIRLDLVDFQIGEDSGAGSNPSESTLDSSPLANPPRRRAGKGRKKATRKKG